MTDEKKPIRLTDADFARTSPSVSPKLKDAALAAERLETFAREKQIKILVSVREVAAVLNIPFDELIQESLIRYQETLE